jgi:hypothetical protein
LDRIFKDFSITIHEIYCSLASDDPYGEVRRGRLVLSGELIAAKCVTSYSPPLNLRRFEEVIWLKFHDSGVAFGGVKSFCYWDGNIPHKGEDLFCLSMDGPLTTIYLVLCCVDWRSQTFKRVGLIIDEDNDGWQREKRRKDLKKPSRLLGIDGSKNPVPTGGRTRFSGARSPRSPELESFDYGSSSESLPSLYDWPSRRPRESPPLLPNQVRGRRRFKKYPDGSPIPKGGTGCIRRITII